MNRLGLIVLGRVTISVSEYLREAGQGAHAQWHVPDLIPAAASEAKLAFVFESPHLHEVKARVPVVGASGRDALRFLSSGSAVGESLGCFIRKHLDAGKGRIAILNVSNVPMQAGAFVGGDAPALDSADWALIEKVRTSRSSSVSSMRNPEARVLSEALVERLGGRLAAFGSRPDCVVVAAGAFAKRMVTAAQGSIADLAVLEVPHPSYNQWNREANQSLASMKDMRTLFADLVE